MINTNNRFATYLAATTPLLNETSDTPFLDEDAAALAEELEEPFRILADGLDDTDLETQVEDFSKYFELDAELIKAVLVEKAQGAYGGEGDGFRSSRVLGEVKSAL
jgi:hypothetical protein